MLLVDAVRIGCHVLHLPARVGEAEVDELDVFFLDHFDHVGRCRHGF
jgi:hypothetical protein